MKTFFVHLSKTGGSTIRKIALNQYGKHFHSLEPTTNLDQIKTWIKEEQCFIATEMHGISEEALTLILEVGNFRKIVIARNPIDRFISFCAYSTKSYKCDQGVGYWGLEEDLGIDVDVNFWLRSCLKYVQNILNYKDNIYLGQFNSKLYYGVYSQWFLSSFMSHFDSTSCSFNYLGDNIYKHIETTRNSATGGLSLRQLIYSFIVNFYDIVGTTDKLEVFIRSLERERIFQPVSGYEFLNSSIETKRLMPNKFRVSNSLISDYYSLIPEDFFFYSACKSLSK